MTHPFSRRPAALALAATLLLAAAPAARFDARRFFSGGTEGRGQLSVVMHADKGVHVRGSGRVLPDGTLVLDQHVEQEGEAPMDRQWRIREVSPGRYAGTLSDATGPVEGDEQGNRLHLGYPAKGGVRIDQWLTLAPDGRSAQNRLVVKKFGITVAHLDETIRKTD